MQGKKLYVGNIGVTASKKQLHELFSGYGEVLDIRIIGKNAFGFIEMSSETEAENAKNSLNGYTLDGQALKVNEAKPANDARGRNYRR